MPPVTRDARLPGPPCVHAASSGAGDQPLELLPHVILRHVLSCEGSANSATLAALGLRMLELADLGDLYLGELLRPPKHACSEIPIIRQTSTIGVLLVPPMSCAIHLPECSGPQHGPMGLTWPPGRVSEGGRSLSLSLEKESGLSAETSQV